MNSEYWLLHKKIITQKLSQLDDNDYNEIVSDAHSELSIKFNSEVHKEVMKKLAIDSPTPA